MSVISWTQPPNMDVPINLPALPELPDTKKPDEVLHYLGTLHSYLQMQNQALEAVAIEKAELREFLSEVLDAIKELDRDAINGLAAVPATAGGAYTAAEQTMLNTVANRLNSLLGAL
jgi:hypothetical protein